MIVLGQFETPDAMLGAARRLRRLGHTRIEGYAPYPLPGLEEAFGLPKSRVPMLVLAGGLAGAVLGYALQWWCNAVDWPINVGGRPTSAPWLNVPITFELAVLFGALTGFVGLMALTGLPRLHHPVFEVAAFRRASIDRFWMSVSCEDGADQEDHVARQLAELGATEISTAQDPAR